MKKPFISIITPTFNNAGILRDFFDCIERQSYPSDRWEVLILDGGSTDDTVKIAQAHHAKIYHNPDRLAEPGVNLGMTLAKGDLFIVLAVDNFLKEPNALENITKAFEDKSVYAAFPKHDSDSTDNIFSRYINTFTDPFNHFVYGYAANARTFYRVYKTIVHTDLYDIYDYSSNSVTPMIAFAQGFTIRSDYRRKKEDAFDDLKPILSLLTDEKKIAYVHSVSVYHHTIRNFDHFFRKQRWATRNSLENQRYGIAYRISELSKGQKFRIGIWPLYALSVIAPLIMGIYSYIRDREPLWLFHPIICFLSAFASLTEVFIYTINKDGKVVSRQ